MPYEYESYLEVPFYNDKAWNMASFGSLEKHDFLKGLNAEHVLPDQNMTIYRYCNFMLRIAGLRDYVDDTLTGDDHRDIEISSSYNIQYFARHNFSISLLDANTNLIIKYLFPQVGDDVGRGNISHWYMQKIGGEMARYPVLISNYHILVCCMGEYLGAGFPDDRHGKITAERRMFMLSPNKIEDTLNLLKSIFESVTHIFSGFVPLKKMQVLEVINVMKSVLKIADDYLKTAEELVNKESTRICHGQSSAEYLANLEMFVSVLNDKSKQLSMIQQACASEFVNISGCLDLVSLTTQEKHDLLRVLDFDIERMRLLANEGLIAQDKNGFMGHRYSNWILRMTNLKSYVNDRLAGDSYVAPNNSVDLQKLISLMSDDESTPLFGNGIPSLLMQYFFPQMGDDVQQGNISSFCMQMIGNNIAQFPVLMQNYCALVDFFHKHLMDSWSEYISRGTFSIYYIDNFNRIFKAVFSNITQVFGGFVPQKKEDVLKITKAMELILKAADVYIEGAKKNIVEEKERICHGQSSAEYLASLEMFISVLNDESKQLSMIQQACASEFVNRSGCEYGELVGVERYERVLKHVEDKWLAYNQTKPTQDPSSTLVAGNAVAYSESCERGYLSL